MSEKLCLCYHGTSKRRAMKIMQEGFKSGTFFATHMEDAIGYGGKWVFEVVFQQKDVPNYWEFIVDEVIPPNRIRKLTQYSSLTYYSNHELGQKVFESNMTEEHNFKGDTNESV